MGRKKRITRERGEAWAPKVAFWEDRQRWVVDCGLKFSPRRSYFTTESDAREFAEAKRLEFLARLTDKTQSRRLEDRKRSAFRLAVLSDSQRNHIAEAMVKAGNDTEALLRAVEFYTRHMSKAGRSRLLCRVYGDYLRAKRRSGRRRATVKDAHVKLRPFIKAYRKQQIQDITTSDVERWLNGRNFTPRTHNSYRAAIVALFNYGIRREYIERNPAEIIDVAVQDQGLPGVHTVAEVCRVLYAARDFVPERYIVTKRGEGKGRGVSGGELEPETDDARIREARARIVPYLAIGYFAGLRPQNELSNLDWKDIDFEARLIRVDPATAKKRRQRYVDMPDNLLAWLAPYVHKSGRIGFSRRILRAVRRSAGVEWPKDVMRHCFGSYHIALHGDAVKTSAQMGHTRTSELFKSYRNLVKRMEAERYWKIVPEPKAKIVKLPIARAG